MPYVEKSIEIRAPLDTVFHYVAHQPENMVRWWTLIELQERVSPPPTTIGSTSRYIYNMMGIRLKGEHQVLDMVENRHLLVKTISGIDATFDFSFAPMPGDATMLTVRVNYALPGTVLGQLLNRVSLEKHNADHLEKGLGQLKQTLENMPANTA